MTVSAGNRLRTSAKQFKQIDSTDTPYGSAVQLRGVNIPQGGSDPSFTNTGSSAAPGNWATLQDFNDIRAKGGNVVRCGFAYTHWNTYASTLWSLMDAQIAAASQAGVWLVYVCFTLPGPNGSNWDYYEGYELNSAGDFYTNSTKRTSFVQMWSEIATRYPNEPAVAGWDLMNEPAPSSFAGWQTTVQDCIDAIRATGDTTPIHIESQGAGWPNPSWPGGNDGDLGGANGTTFFTDSAAQLVLHDHYYHPQAFTFGSGQTWPHTYTNPSNSQQVLWNEAGILADWQQTAAMTWDFYHPHLLFQTSKGLPLMVGEFGASPNNVIGGHDYSADYVKDAAGALDTLGLHWCHHTYRGAGGATEAWYPSYTPANFASPNAQMVSQITSAFASQPSLFPSDPPPVPPVPQPPAPTPSATFLLRAQQSNPAFAPGSSLDVYDAQDGTGLERTPPKAKLFSVTVAANGTVLIGGLEFAHRYVAGKFVSGVWTAVAFTTDASESTPDTQTGGGGIGAAGFGAVDDGKAAVYDDAGKVFKPGRLPERVFYVEDYGAKGDGTRGTTLAITSGQITVANTFGGLFGGSLWAADDVGKPIVIDGAGVGGADLYTHIASFIDSTHITVTDAASTTKTNTPGAWGTDDTAAIQACIDACRDRPAGSGASQEHGGVVQFGPRTYWLGTAPRTDRHGNAVLALPDTSLVGGSVTLRGIDQVTVLRSHRTGGAYSSLLGPPSIIGGPTVENGGGMQTGWRVYVEDLKLTQPSPPTLCGVDLRLVARARVSHVEVNCDQVNSEYAVPTGKKYLFGIRMPDNNNFGLQVLDYPEVYGYSFGLVLCTDHGHIRHGVVKWCDTGLGLVGGGGALLGHACKIEYLEIEQCVIEVSGYTANSGQTSLAANDPFYLDGFIDIEQDLGSGKWWQHNGFGIHVADSNNQLYGRLLAAVTTENVGVVPGGVLVNGGANLEVLDVAGAVGPNALTTPVSTTVYRNATGRPQSAMLQTTLNPNASLASTVVAIGPTSSPATQVAIAQLPSGGANGQKQTLSFRVPFGWYYKVTNTNSTNDSLVGVGQ